MAMEPDRVDRHGVVAVGEAEAGFYQFAGTLTALRSVDNHTDLFGKAA